MTPEQAVMRIDGEILEQLREYSTKTGVPIIHCASEALRNWLDTVAAQRLEALGLEPLTPRFDTRSIGYKPS